jgi:hypothetical protein
VNRSLRLHLVRNHCRRASANPEALRNGLVGCENRISAKRIAGAQEPTVEAVLRSMNSVARGDLLRLQQHPPPTLLGDTPNFSALVRGRSKRFLGNAKTST